MVAGQAVHLGRTLEAVLGGEGGVGRRGAPGAARRALLSGGACGHRGAGMAWGWGRW